MKARELAEILMRTPDAEVVHYEYTGGGTPLLKINTTYVELEGETSSSYDGGNFVHTLTREKPRSPSAYSITQESIIEWERCTREIPQWIT
jgi:hypothetical protein